MGINMCGRLCKCKGKYRHMVKRKGRKEKEKKNLYLYSPVSLCLTGRFFRALILLVERLLLLLYKSQFLSKLLLSERGGDKSREGL